MKVRQVVLLFPVLFISSLFSAPGGEVVTLLPFRDFQNIVSQQLVVAQLERNVNALQEAVLIMKDITDVESENYRKYERPNLGEYLSLQLSVLETAWKMQDRAFNPQEIKAGLNGRVPWPSDRERPAHLSDRPLWTPGQNPEDYKTANPQLYALYKPLYDENIRQTEIYKREGSIKSVIWDFLRKIRSSLEYAKNNQRDDAQRYHLFISIVEKTITDEQLKKDILSETPPEYLHQNIYWQRRK